MKLLVHDMPSEVFTPLGLSTHDMTVITAKGKHAPCLGCFGCWLKTPGYCHIQDELQHIGAISGQSDEVILISENWYGGFSADIKNVLDRSISTSTPFFVYRGGKIHHGRRYKKERKLKVFFYGGCTDLERARFIRRNS